MAQHNNGSSNTSQQLVNPVFHDFLGMKPTDSPVVLAPKTAADLRLSEASPSSASASGGGVSSGGGGPRGSDVGSERQVGNHLEGVPFYGPRSDFSGTEINNRLVGSKRSNSDSTFMGSSRDAFQMGPDSLQNSHLMKILRNAGGGDRHKRSNEDEVMIGMHPMRPTSASQIFQPSPGSKIDASKRERSILMNVSPSMQQPPRGGQLAPLLHQMASNKIWDPNAGPSFISQPAADEGSRTGIKGPGILSSINTTTAANDKTPSAVLLCGGRPKPVTNIMDPESSTPRSHQGLASASCQMTIFYGGQAHVFDDVHPNKADIIMALAGSNGGSWSTTYSPKSTAKVVKDSNLLSGENETGAVTNTAFPQELHGRLTVTGSSSHAMGSADRVSTPAGAHQGSIVAKETRSQVQAADPGLKTKERSDGV